MHICIRIPKDTLMYTELAFHSPANIMLIFNLHVKAGS